VFFHSLESKGSRVVKSEVFIYKACQLSDCNVTVRFDFLNHFPSCSVFSDRKIPEISQPLRVNPMRRLLGILILGLFFTGFFEPVFARSRGICSGYGGPHLNVHTQSGYRRGGGGGGGDELIMLLMLSSTSTTIYCISIAGDKVAERDTTRSRRNRYSSINYDRLQEQGARGRGEYLTALSYSLGCPATAAAEFGESVQKNYATLFKRSAEFEGERFLAQLDQIISDNPRLRAQCSSDAAGINRF
jgi:hypothetical protein